MYILTLEQIKALPTVPERVTELAIENEKLKTHTGELAQQLVEAIDLSLNVYKVLRPLANRVGMQIVDGETLDVSALLDKVDNALAAKDTDSELRKTHYNFVTSLMLLLKLTPATNKQDLENIFKEVKSLRDKVQVFEQIQALTKGIYASQNAQAARV